MKVLYIVTGIRPPVASGSEFIKNLIFEVSQKGIQATIISPIYIHTQKDMYLWADEMRANYNVRFILIDAPKFIKRNFLLHLALTPLLITLCALKVLLSEKFDIIHEFTSTPIILFRGLIYKAFRTPSVFSLAVLNTTILGKLFWFKLFDFGTAYLIPSQAIINKLKHSGIKKDKLAFLPPGIITKNFNLNLTKTQARQKIGLTTNLFTFTYFGSPTEEKGVYDLVQAAHLLSQEVKDKIHIVLFCFYLKGYGDFEMRINRIRDQATQNLHVYDKFISIPLLLRASDCVIYPQRTGHGTTIPPISALEVLASKTPIIATDILGLSEYIDGAGLIIPSANPKALAQAMTSVYMKRKEFMPNKRIEKFDLNTISNQLISIYQKVHEKQI